MNHVSVCPTNENGPTQGQRKTLTRVGIEPTTVVVVVVVTHPVSNDKSKHLKIDVTVMSIINMILSCLVQQGFALCMQTSEMFQSLYNI